MLADFELALFGLVQANVARRFFVIGKFLAAIEVDVFEIIFGLPLPGSSFDLLLQANGFGVGKVVETFDLRFFVIEAFLTLF